MQRRAAYLSLLSVALLALQSPTCLAPRRAAEPEPDISKARAKSKERLSADFASSLTGLTHRLRYAGQSRNKCHAWRGRKRPGRW